MIQPNDVILFQGDSITDCHRGREVANPNDPHNIHALGCGYAKIASAELLAQRPGDNLSFLNRGISGNRIVDLYGRIKLECINLNPNLISVLIGVNDTWHEFSRQNGVEVPKFERLYRAFLTEIREALPSVKFVVCEPFVLKCGVVTDDWVVEWDQRRAVACKLAQEFRAPFVQFQAMFDEAVRLAPPEYWAADGVHPTAAGHMLMAKTWLKQIVGA